MDNPEEDFQSGAEEMERLLDRFEEAGCSSGAVMGGAMQALIFRMAIGAPDTATVLGFMGSCMSSAAYVMSDADESDTEH